VHAERHKAASSSQRIGFPADNPTCIKEEEEEGEPWKDGEEEEEEKEGKKSQWMESSMGNPGKWLKTKKLFSKRKGNHHK
jgi:hypothetical protein